MYVITFRLIGVTPSTASVTTIKLSEVVGLLEVAKAQYKVFQDSTYLSPDVFGFGEVPGWLGENESFQ